MVGSGAKDRLARLDASAVAGLLVELGQRIELSGDSPFKARAYYRAAESLVALAQPLEEVVAGRRLRDIPGVGEAIADKIAAFHETGLHPTLEALRAEAPASALELLRVPGLPAQKARKLHQELGIASLAALEEACRRDGLAGVKGLGPALQKKILQGIGIVRSSHGQRLINQAGELLEAAAANLKATRTELKRVVPAGDFRRGAELVHELSLVAELPDLDAKIETIRINDEVGLHLAGAARYGVALLLATGTAEHVATLAAVARERGLTLDGGGLRRGAELLPCRDEKAVYRTLGLPFIEPELREGGEEIALAKRKKLPKLVHGGDIRGVLHCHTDRSDGVNTLAQMASAARERGHQYFGVADHSRSAGYAGGLSLEAVRAQHAEAAALNRGSRGFRILKGIESDILPDGSLDYPDEVLGSFDFVVASIHSRFGLDETTQTERLLRAVANPHTTVLGHMTGRMLLRREGYALDIERVLQACAEHEVAVEINANPRRLDLDWRWHGRGLDLGCTFSINPDAHSTGELDLMRWGVAMARKGGVPKDRVLNTMELEEITEFLTERKRRKLKRQRASRSDRS